MEQVSEEVYEEVIDAKNHYSTNFNHLTRNFYVMKAALRYFKVKNGMSITSSKISEKFPVESYTAGCALKTLDEIGVVESRTDSSSKRYMPEDINLEKMEEVQNILVDSREINDFHG